MYGSGRFPELLSLTTLICACVPEAEAVAKVQVYYTDGSPELFHRRSVLAQNV